MGTWSGNLESSVSQMNWRERCRVKMVAFRHWEKMDNLYGLGLYVYERMTISYYGL